MFNTFPFRLRFRFEIHTHTRLPNVVSSERVTSILRIFTHPRRRSITTLGYGKIFFFPFAHLGMTIDRRLKGNTLWREVLAEILTHSPLLVCHFISLHDKYARAHLYGTVFKPRKTLSSDYFVEKFRMKKKNVRYTKKRNPVHPARIYLDGRKRNPFEFYKRKKKPFVSFGVRKNNHRTSPARFRKSIDSAYNLCVTRVLFV